MRWTRLISNTAYVACLQQIAAPSSTTTTAREALFLLWELLCRQERSKWTSLKVPRQVAACSITAFCSADTLREPVHLQCMPEQVSTMQAPHQAS